MAPVRLIVPFSSCSPKSADKVRLFTPISLPFFYLEKKTEKHYDRVGSIVKYIDHGAGTTSDGKPIITTLRAMGNMTFGANMRNTKPIMIGVNWYYSRVMGKVGEYNQRQNRGNGYNNGYPYFGEHTYSGSYIYYGYFGSFYKK